MTVFYAIKKGDSYLQSIEPNERYIDSSVAPTMGTPYQLSDFRTIWGKEPKGFEMLTATNNIKTIFEQYRWKDLEPAEIRIIPLEVIE